MSRSTRPTLTQALLESRRTESSASSSRAARVRETQARPDHVALADGDAALSFRLFESLGRKRFACDVVLACATAPNPTFAELEEQTYVERVARERGAWLARAGSGTLHRTYAARLAAPGRIALAVDSRLIAAGGMGTLVLRATPLEAAAALGGGMMALPTEAVTIVRLLGRPPAWMTGEDVGFELHRRQLLGEWAAGSLLEFHPLEGEGLPVAARFAMARECAALGATAALFPSDDTLRRFLQTQGREADWKSLPMPESDERRGLELDFSDLEPLIVRPDGEIMPARERLGTRVDAVRMGPEATHADLARFAAALRNGRSDQVDVSVAIGSRQVRELAIRSGAMAVLGAAGVRIEAGADRIRPARLGSGLSLACCDPAASRAGTHRAGLDSCAAAARTGAIADARGLEMPREPNEGDEVWFAQSILRPSGGPLVVPGANGLLEAGITGPMRGTVLLKLGDQITADRILPWGARVQPSRLDVVALAEFAFAGLDARLPERAAAHGGGWIVAGQEFGAGPWREQIGWVIAHLGLRAILARSYAPELRRRLIQHGVLALQFITLGDYQDIREGDELEMPDLPEGLESGKPLVVRNLTSGTPYTLRHDLDADEIEQVRLGGLLAAVAHEGA